MGGTRKGRAVFDSEGKPLVVLHVPGTNYVLSHTIRVTWAFVRQPKRDSVGLVVSMRERSAHIWFIRVDPPRRSPGYMFVEKQPTGHGPEGCG